MGEVTVDGTTVNLESANTELDQDGHAIITVPEQLDPAKVEQLRAEIQAKLTEHRGEPVAVTTDTAGTQETVFSAESGTVRS